MDGFDEPDHATGTFFIDQENSSLLNNKYSGENKHSRASLTLSTKLSWDTDLCSQSIEGNRPTISCRICLQQEGSKEILNKSILTEVTPTATTVNPLQLSKKIGNAVLNNTADQTEIDMQLSEAINESDVLCVKINSVAVNGLSCVEQIGRRSQNGMSKVRFDT